MYIPTNEKYKLPSSVVNGTGLGGILEEKIGDGDRKTRQMRTEHSYIQLGARTYDPEIGRFMSVDPLFEMFPEHSPYHYCYNSPLVWSDPSGMFSETETDLDGTIWLISYDIIAVYTPGIDDPLEPHGTKHYEKREISRTRWAGSSAGGRKSNPFPSPSDFYSLKNNMTYMVFGIETKRVYLYNSQGQRVKISFDDFFRSK